MTVTKTVLLHGEIFAVTRISRPREQSDDRAIYNVAPLVPNRFVRRFSSQPKFDFCQDGRGTLPWNVLGVDSRRIRYELELKRWRQSARTSSWKKLGPVDCLLEVRRRR